MFRRRKKETEIRMRAAPAQNRCKIPSKKEDNVKRIFSVLMVMFFCVLLISPVLAEGNKEKNYDFSLAGFDLNPFRFNLAVEGSGAARAKLFKNFFLWGQAGFVVSKNNGPWDQYGTSLGAGLGFKWLRLYGFVDTLYNKPQESDYDAFMVSSWRVQADLVAWPLNFVAAYSKPRTKAVLIYEAHSMVPLETDAGVFLRYTNMRAYGEALPYWLVKASFTLDSFRANFRVYYIDKDDYEYGGGLEWHPKFARGFSVFLDVLKPKFEDLNIIIPNSMISQGLGIDKNLMVRFGIIFRLGEGHTNFSMPRETVLTDQSWPPVKIRKEADTRDEYWGPPFSGSICSITKEGCAPFKALIKICLTGGKGPYTYSVNYGDGQSEGGETIGSVKFEPLYEKPGKYTVVFDATDALGALIHLTDIITAKDCPPPPPPPPPCNNCDPALPSGSQTDPTPNWDASKNFYKEEVIQNKTECDFQNRKARFKADTQTGSNLICVSRMQYLLLKKSQAVIATQWVASSRTCHIWLVRIEPLSSSTVVANIWGVAINLFKFIKNQEVNPTSTTCEYIRLVFAEECGANF